jgi:hypothetical protein
MNQKTTIVLCLAIFGAVFGKTRLMGGSNPQVISHENKSTANELMTKAKAGASMGAGLLGEAKTKLANLKLVYYASQVVAGTNYTMVYELPKSEGGSEFYCAKIFKPLPYTKLPPQLNGFESGQSLHEVCGTCVGN